MVTVHDAMFMLPESWSASGGDGILNTRGQNVGRKPGSTNFLAWWDADADDYQATHGEFLGDADFVWCPEGVREADVALLGEVAGKRVLEVGCGQAACARWLTAQGADAVAMDLSAGMLRHAREGNARTGLAVPLIQATAERLPLATESVDTACSAFGAVPFVTSVDAVFAEVNRVLRPGGRWVFSVTHPMRWIDLRTASLPK